MTVQSRPMLIPGRWRQGFTLDYHTISSSYLGDDEFGHPQFETRRTPIGDLLYRLKYRSDRTVVCELVDAAVTFLSSWNPGATILLPVPPSRERLIQPVYIVGEAVAERVGMVWARDAIRRIRDIPELKNVYNYDDRTRLLDGAHEVERTKIQDRRVLLFDDLYRSGATMNAITAALYDKGGVDEVCALTLTRTRSNL